MKNHFILLLLTLVFPNLHSQEFNIGMSVTKTDLTNNFYEKDTTANALVIYDYGNAFFDKTNFWLNVEIKQKIKILTKEGLDRGEIEIELYKNRSSKESIKNISATTYNIENDNVVKSKLEESAIFKEENENWTTVKFVMPNVKVGSIIVLNYTKTSTFIRKFQPWYFQGRDPSLYSEYNTSIPGNYEYNVKLTGTIPLESQENAIEHHCIEAARGASANCLISKYVMKNIPAYKEEDYTTSPLNYMSRIEYELSVVRGFDGSVDKLTKSWKDVDKEIKTDNDFGRQLGKKSVVKNILPESIKSISDRLTKAKAIYQFVLDNYKWNKKTQRYDVSIKNLIKEQVGSAFEINLLLENLLTSEGYKVYPILLSTRSNGFATKIYPVLTDFNYVILKTTIDSIDYLLDATDPYLSFGEIPFRCLNQYGRLFDFDTASYWEDIKEKRYSINQLRVKLSLNENNQLSGIVKNKVNGYPSHRLKRSYDENAELYLEHLRSKYAFVTINKHKSLNTKINDYYFEEELDISIDEEFNSDKIYFNPFLIKYFDENPFKLQERTYPIDFGYKDIYFYTMELDLKDKLKIIEIPEPMNFVLPNNSGSVIFSVSDKDDKLTIFFKLKFDKAIYNSEYYDALKQFMSKVVEIQNNSIVVLEKQ